MSSALEEFGVIVAIVGGLIGIVYSLIKISEWWSERKEEEKPSPRIYLETNQGLKKTSENVDVFSLCMGTDMPLQYLPSADSNSYHAKELIAAFACMS